MAEQSNVSPAPITPSLPQIEAGRNPITSFQNPGLIDARPTMPPPVIPSGIQPMVEARPELEGDMQRGPGPKKSNSTVDYVKGIQQAMKDPNLTRDKYKYGRAYSYGSGYKQMNFERYYNHPKYKKLGFSPYRDNDAHYNQNSSWWDDFGRMRTQFATVAFSAFTDMLPFGTDERASADAMEKGMAIGTSSRGGVGGWVTNFGLQAGYTVGIMGEMFLENLALAAITFGTGGGTAPLLVSKNIIGAGKLFRGIDKVSDVIKALKNVDTATDVWKGFNVLDKTKDFLNWATPFEGTRDLIKTGGNLNKLKPLAQARKTFGTFYKDVRELNLVFSESLLEGQSASNTYQQKLLDDFYVKNHRMPNDEEAKLIYQKGESMKSTVSFANDIAIYFTNKLVFKDMLKGFDFSALSKGAFIQGGKKALTAVKAGTWRTGMDITAETTSNMFMKTGKSLLTSSYAPWSRKYFLANLSEGLQESSQEAIAKSAEYYYDRIDSDPSQAGLVTTLNSIGKGVGSQFSAQGFDTFIQGYLMGSLIQGVQGSVMGTGKKVYNLATGNKDAAVSADRENQIKNAHNSLAQNAGIFKGTEERNETLSVVNTASKEKTLAEESGDEKRAKDMQAEMENSHYITLASSGTTNVLTDFIDDMLTLSDQDLVDAYITPDNKNLSADKIRAKLTKSKATAESVDKKYKIAKERLPNRNEPWLIDAEKDPVGAIESLQRYKAHEKVIQDMIFNTQMYEDVVTRIQDINTSLAGGGNRLQNFFKSLGGNAITNTNVNYIQALTDSVLRNDLIDANKAQIKILETGTPEQQKKAKRLLKINNFLSEWTGQISDFKDNVGSAQKAAVSETEREVIATRARMQKNAIVKDKRGRVWTVISTEGNRVVLVDKNGTQKETFKRQLELLDDSAVTRPVEFNEVEGDELSASYSRMYNIFEEYIKEVADLGDSYVLSEQLNKAFTQISDLHTLQVDLKRIVNSINMMADPNYFERFVGMEVEIENIRRERRIENLKKSLTSFKQKADLNAFLNSLYDIGVFVMEEDINKLLNFEMVNFFDATTMQPVDPASKKYQEVLDIVEDYAEKWQVQVTGKVTPEFEGRSEDYSYVHRKREDKDKRTKADFEKQYKLDYTKPTLTSEVLQNIIDSPYATPREKALARRLLSTVSKEATITFVNNGESAGTYNPETGQVIIDPRYSSVEFAEGERGVPFETTILRNYISSLVSSALTSDPVFAEKIEKLRATAEAHSKAKGDPRPLLGTATVEEFIKEAMTNQVFQKELAAIPYESTGKPSSLWKEFLNSLKVILKNIVNKTKSGTALDEALYIITAKIDAPAPMPSAPGTTTAQGTSRTSAATGVSLSTDDIKRDKLLLDKLVAAYRTWAGVKEGLEDVAAKGTVDEIAALEDFDIFIEENSDALTIIREHQKPVSKSATPKPKGIWDVDDVNKPYYYFSGRVVYKDPKNLVDLLNMRVRVVENHGVRINENDEKEHLIMLEDEEGHRFTIDFLSDESDTFVMSNQAPQANVKKEDETTEDDDINQSAKYNVEHDSKSKTRVKVSVDSKTGEISIVVNPKALKIEYDQKIWATAKRIQEGVYTEPLHISTFSSYAEYEAYVIERAVLEKIKMTKAIYDTLSKGKRTKLEYQEALTDKALLNVNLERRSRTEGEQEYTEEELNNLYASITNGKDLDNWYNIVRNSGKFTGEQLKDMYANAKAGLAEVTMKNLTVNKVVKMVKGKLMIVKSNDGVRVQMIAFEDRNNPNAKLIPFTKKQLNKIDMLHHDFIATSATDTITEEAEKDMQEGMSDIANVEKEQLDILDEFEKLTPEQVNAKLKDAFNNCKIK